MAQDIPPVIEEYGTSSVRAKINGALNQIKWVLAYLHDVQEVKLPAALQLLAAAKQLRRFARALEKTADEAAVAEMQMSDTTYFAGEGFEAVLHDGSRRKEWQHESLANEVCDRAVSQLHSRFPEVPLRTLRKISQGVLNEVVAVGRVEWRSKALRDRGIDPDEFSVKVPGAASVELTGDASYADMTGSREGAGRGRH